MLHDRHQLKRIVARLFDTGQDLFRKFTVRGDLLVLLRHTRVRLVDKERILALEILVRPNEFLFVKDGRAPHERIGVLRCVAREDRKSFFSVVEGIHDRLYVTAVPQRVFAGEKDLPRSVTETLERMAGGIPIVEIAFFKDSFDNKVSLFFIYNYVFK